VAEKRRADTLPPGGAANPARIYDYLLGGTTNYDADRRAAERLMSVKPDLRANVRANRAFLGRAVRYLAGEGGIAQFLDIGTGIPAMNNTHEVAQQVNPASRVVYVDYDPVVLVHAKALLGMTMTAEGSVSFVDADLRDPAAILTKARQTLDFGKPIAVMLLGILYVIEEAERPHGIVGHLMEATAPGSYLCISHPASDLHAEEAARGAREYVRYTGIHQTNRTQAEVTLFFDGLEILEPGVVPANRWRPGPGDDTTEELSNWAVVGRKPG
jgi:hypothetical protein